MSIQTQLDRINQGVADQAAIMTQIKNALQGKGSSGGGGSVETCTLTLTGGLGRFLAFVTGDGDPVYININTSGTNQFSLACPTILFTTFCMDFDTWSGDIERLNAKTNTYSVFKVYGDCTIQSITGEGSND